ncbi:MAG: glycosyltransferase [Defluviitaleaceae bacterium]|nr:glycosyltransferase [Defluviitaleaceae bacterium]MCL2263022.1 glycosyltransferase [Defluviitaleaceae bacterium]
MNTLSLCMIVKNGEKYIEQCIESILPAITEMIVVDTGSADSTLEKIKRFNPSIFHFEWKNNFADARNFSLQYARGDYVIVLDADEIIYAEDLPKLMEAVKNTSADCITVRFHNLTDEKDENMFSIHEGLRIFKRGAFRFCGAIHEQPVFNFSGKPLMEHSMVRVKHFGYLKSNTAAKFERNMAILQDVLEKNPNDAFHLFNMGNQYMSIGDNKTALKFYDRADRLKDITLAYSPHLIFRRAACLKNSGRWEECLLAAAEGLKHYPSCTDLEFLRGTILAKLKRFTLAISSFEKCAAMNQAPPNLCFFPDTATSRPLIELAEIYNYMDDHKNAVDNYLKALKIDGKKYFLVYKIAASLNKMFDDKNIVYQNICNLFADINTKQTAIVIADALLNERLFTQAATALSRYVNETDTDIFFLKGRMLFYSKDYKAAFSNFKNSIPSATGILPKNRAHTYMTACALLCRDCLLKEPIWDSSEAAVYHAFLCESDAALDKKTLHTISDVLSHLLAVREYDAFQKALNVLNLVDSNDVLLYLSKVYSDNNFRDMAVKTILRSIKELGALNSAAADILHKEFVV